MGCPYHLYLDVNPLTGTIKFNFPKTEPWDLPYSCALDLADAGAINGVIAGRVMNVTRERIRQIEESSLRRANQRLTELMPGPDWLAEHDDGPPALPGRNSRAGPGRSSQ